MQNCYVGDVGDFGKYGLLLALRKAGLSPIGVVWYFVPRSNLPFAKKSNDGKHTTFLQDEKKRRKYEPCNSNLYWQLHSIINNNNRSVVAIREHSILGKDSQFFEKDVPHKNRDAWLREALKAVDGCNLLVLDPDNGLMPNHPKDRRKYVEDYELKAFLQTNATVVLYQHLDLNHKSEYQAKRLCHRIKSLDSTREIEIIWFRRGTGRFFAIILPTQHKNIVEQGVQEFMKSFGEHAKKM